MWLSRNNEFSVKTTHTVSGRLLRICRQNIRVHWWCRRAPASLERKRTGMTANQRLSLAMCPTFHQEPKSSGMGSVGAGFTNLPLDVSLQSSFRRYCRRLYLNHISLRARSFCKYYSSFVLSRVYSLSPIIVWWGSTRPETIMPSL